MNTLAAISFICLIITLKTKKVFKSQTLEKDFEYFFRFLNIFKAQHFIAYKVNMNFYT